MSGQGLMGRARVMLGGAHDQNARGDEMNPTVEEEQDPPQGQADRGVLAKTTGCRWRLHRTKGGTQSLSERISIARGHASYETLQRPSGGRKQACRQDTQCTPGAEDFDERQGGIGGNYDEYGGPYPYYETGPLRGGAGINPACRKASAAEGRHRQGGPGPLNITQEEGDGGGDGVYTPYKTPHVWGGEGSLEAEDREQAPQ